MKNPIGRSFVKMLALALGMACTHSALAQHFKHVNVQGGAPLVQIAPGGVSVWARASNGNPYILKGSTFVLANSISLTQIAVGGGNMLQKDAVWGLDSSGNIYKATKSGTSWVFSRVPGVLDLIAVGPGYQDTCHPYEVWGLNPSAQIYRYNYCTNGFDQVPGILCDLHVGGGDIWGADCGPDVFRFNFSTGSFDEISTFVSFPILAVGPNGTWAVDTFNSIAYEFENGFPDKIGCCYTQIQAGGNGVWALNGNKIYRLEPSTFSFVQFPGSFVSISVGTGGGVWGLDGAGHAYGFTTP